MYKTEINIYENDKLKETLIPKFEIGQVVYIVKKGLRKIRIVETKIWAFYYTNIINYKIALGSGYGYGKYYNDSDNNIFAIKEEAFEYAEKLNRRKNIKFISGL